MVSMNWDTVIPAEWAMNLKQAGYQEIALYAVKNSHNMTARNLLPRRDVGQTVDVDMVLETQSSGERASIVAKGSVPNTSDAFGKQLPYPMWQYSLGFRVHERDLAKDARLQTRNIDIIERELHRLEDNIFINGDSGHNIKGVVGASAANTLGSVSAASTNPNKGSWDGQETGGAMDPYSDINLAFSLQKPDFRMANNRLLLTVADYSHLFELDSMRVSFADRMCGLFGKQVGDYSWAWVSDLCPSGYAFICPNNIMAGEMVFSQDITIDTDFGKDEGGNYFIKLYEWLSTSIYQDNAYVRIATT